jgi:uncharacterized protein involved in copper resistance
MKIFTVLFAATIALTLVTSTVAQAYEPYHPPGKQIPVKRSQQNKTKSAKQTKDQAMIEKMQAMEMQHKEMQAQMTNCMNNCQEKASSQTNQKSECPMIQNGNATQSDLKSSGPNTPWPGRIHPTDGKDKTVGQNHNHDK